jgi:glycine C-acetyltransferase
MKKERKLTNPLRYSIANFARPYGDDLLGRTEAYYNWQQSRHRAGLFPYSHALDRAPAPRTRITHADGRTFDGVNFASQDYLSLTSHPAIHEAVRETLREFGPHSAGAAVLNGNTRLSLELERAIGEMLQTEHVLLFPTGWGAGYGAIVGLVREDDHIVMDELAHACLQSGARAATKNIIHFKHLDNDAVAATLADIRSRDITNGIMVITEGLFSMDSDSPDLPRLQEICRQYKATLLVDVAHDLGAVGEGGTGHIGRQGMIGKIDLVMGSFSKTFASNGGFLATHSPAVRQFVKCYGGPHTFSNALSPLQAGVVLTAIRIVRSPEGGRLRADLLAAVNSLRDEFLAHGITCMGSPSPIVPVPVGSEAAARIAAALLFEEKVFANLVEFPAVRVGTARIRVQVMSSHTEEHVSEAVPVIVRCIQRAKDLVVEQDSGLSLPWLNQLAATAQGQHLAG